MNILTPILVLVLWIGYSILEGIKEAYLYNYHGSSSLAYNKDLHPMYNAQRAILIFSLGMLLGFAMGWLAILAVIGLALVFPVFHDEFYYFFRRKISLTIKSESLELGRPTCSAKVAVSNCFVRISLGIVGLAAYLAAVFL